MRYNQTPKFFNIPLTSDTMVVARWIQDWMTNGPWNPEDLDDLAGKTISRKILESLSFYVNLTKEVLAVLESAGEPNLAGLVDSITCLFLYIMVYVTPKVPKNSVDEFKKHSEKLRTILVQLVIAFLRDDPKKKKNLKIGFGIIIRETFLTIKIICDTESK
jgi:hypothetical protein